MKKIVIVFVIFLTVSSYSQFRPVYAAESGEMVLYPIADVTVQSNRADTNYGAYDTLKVLYLNSSGEEVYAYTLLEFDLSGIPPMISATLSIYCYYLTGPQTVRLYTYSGSGWSEGDMTWSTQPSNLERTDKTLNMTEFPSWYDWTLTDEVGTTYGLPSKFLTVVLVAEPVKDNMTLQFFSKEQTYPWLTGYRPKLTLRYQKIETFISLSMEPYKVDVGENMTIVGTINDNIVVDGKRYYPTVALTYTDPGGNSTVRWISSDSAGRFEDVFMPNVAGRWNITAEWPGIDIYASARKSIVVNVLDTISPGIPPTILIVTIGLITLAAVVMFYLFRRRPLSKLKRGSE